MRSRRTRGGLRNPFSRLDRRRFADDTWVGNEPSGSRSDPGPIAPKEGMLPPREGLLNPPPETRTLRPVPAKDPRTLGPLKIDAAPRRHRGAPRVPPRAFRRRFGG